MSISTRAYCENTPCTSTTTLLDRREVLAPHWIVANIADVNGEWCDDSPVHARHFCSDQCYREYVDQARAAEEDTDQAWRDIDADFRFEDSRLNGRA